VCNLREAKMNKSAVLFPGQGAQFKGMGKSLFPIYRDLSRRASDILGYSIEELCLEDHKKRLNLTQFTQPAIYVVNAMAYWKWRASIASDFSLDFVAGHSLGEYNALLAADVFDFEMGLKLVKKRGELMGAAAGGGMAAVVGMDAEIVQQLLDENHLQDIDLANFNTPRQLVIAGPKATIAKAEKLFTEKKGRCVVLNVSAPFHSRYMRPAQKEFAAYLDAFTFDHPKIPVVANATARPYQAGKIAETLADQICSPVRWTCSIRYLMGQGVTDYHESGSTILIKMVDEIREMEGPIVAPITASPSYRAGSAIRVARPSQVSEADTRAEQTSQGGVDEMSVQIAATTPLERERACFDPTIAEMPKTEPQSSAMARLLGSSVFRQRYGTKFAYVAGAMYRGIASPKLVVRMGKAGLIGFFGTGGLTLQEIEEGINYIQGFLSKGEAYGSNLLANYERPDLELATVRLLLKHKVRNIEAAAFIQLTPALVLFRLKGLSRNEQGTIVCTHNIIAKVSRPEVAEMFMSPPPAAIVEKLVQEGNVTAEEATMAQDIPMSHDICVEADSGGHTDGAIPTVVLPTMLHLRDDLSVRYGYDEPICMGQAGGIGTPDAAAAAFVMGADFILTGSINQCTVDAGTSAAAKNLLQDINVQDTDYAPAGDMFELGAKVQVLKKGVFFPNRANRLFNIYQNCNGLDEIPEKTIRSIEKNYFKKSIHEIWSETKAYLTKIGRTHEIARAESDAKHKMALVFRWYFFYSSQLAMKGDSSDRVNYQVHTGPALGAFNQWVKGTALEAWTCRHADEIGVLLMTETASYLRRRFEKMGDIVSSELSQ
jgi:trans-AT polyketide synthase/acyltransferase/oxidoreductase domain-containing protein